jgi:uncharacterized protein YkwD
MHRASRPPALAWSSISRFAARAVLCVALCASAARAQDADGPADAPKPAEVRAKIQTLLGQYRSPKLDLDRRAEIVGQLFELGDEGAKRAVPELAKDFRSREKSYPAKFAKAAAKVMEKRAKGKEFKQDLERLRAEVLAVSRDPALTKEKIVERADPARRQLEEMLSLTAEDVLGSDEMLRRDRETLLQVLQWWRTGLEQLAASEGEAAAAKSRPADKKKAAPAPPEPDAFEKALAESEALVATMAAIPDRADRAVLQSNREASKSLDPAEVRGTLALNVLRARLGIGALPVDLKLCAASRDHSKDMAERKFFAHESPLPGKKTPWDRAKLAGTTAGAENIFAGSEVGEAAIEAWWHSPGHHVNMMAPHKRVGLGRHQGHWTQMFGG